MTAALPMPPDTLRALLSALRDGATMPELVRMTGRSTATVFRDLADLRALGVVLDTGPYRVRDWGLFDPGALK